VANFVTINDDLVNADQVVLVRNTSRGEFVQVTLTLSGGQKKILRDVTIEEVKTLLNGEVA
jgi:hypothetical protein